MHECTYCSKTGHRASQCPWRPAVLLALALVLAGCTVVPAGTAHKTCSLLDTALSEADMAEAWYIEAGEALKACGIRDATERAARKACHAQRRDGADLDCGALP